MWPIRTSPRRALLEERVTELLWSRIGVSCGVTTLAEADCNGITLDPSMHLQVILADCFDLFYRQLRISNEQFLMDRTIGRRKCP